MKPAIDILEERISAAMAAVTGSRDAPAIVRPATDPKFGDYQANGVMALAKQLKTNPRKLAQQVVNNLDLSDICEPPEVAGAGFINLRLKADLIAERLLQVGKDPANLGIDKASQPKTIVVDFSSPNIAKEMHVGHLRSTIIGDSICRMLEFLGHKIIRQNHIGDWGTALGKVILGLWHMCMAEKHGGKPYYENELEDLKVYANNKQELENICNRIRMRHEEDWEEDFEESRGDGRKRFRPFLKNLKDREKSKIWEKITILYQYVNLLEESLVGMGLMTPTRKKKKSYVEGEEPFEYISIPYESLSRHITAMLQNIDDEDNEQEKDAWERIREISLKYCHEIYRILNVKLSIEDVRGESAYRKDLPKVVKDLMNNPNLKEKGLVRESDGAICVFPEEFKDKEGKPLPLIIQKSDGAYLYATTDLAALRYRITQLKADAIIYVTDARQKLHFEMLFAVAEMAGWDIKQKTEDRRQKTELVHVTFGSVLGENGTPLKTRSGENVKLKDLLDEAVERARKIVEEKNPELVAEQKEKIAKAVGIGAVKYADFSNNRTSDYVFSFDKMLAMDGNTVPYMQYAYARVKSIERKAQERGIDAEGELADLQSIHLIEPDELDLGKHLIRYGEAIQAAAADYRPNYLTAYLYELAQKFSSFYTNCPVLDAGPDKRPTRLLLCDLTAMTIKHGLSELLGIEVVEQM
jgi:arginyl-tRNA synthetase